MRLGLQSRVSTCMWAVVVPAVVGSFAACGLGDDPPRLRGADRSRLNDAGLSAASPNHHEADADRPAADGETDSHAPGRDSRAVSTDSTAVSPDSTAVSPDSSVASLDGSSPDGHAGGDLSAPSPRTAAPTVENVQSTGNDHWGVRSLELPYRAPSDGLLVLRLSWYSDQALRQPTVVSFADVTMDEAGRRFTERFRLHRAYGAIYTQRVSAGQSGVIEAVFNSGARRVTMTAVTASGASRILPIVATITDADPPPAEIGLDVRLDRPALLLSLLSSSAAIDSVLRGTGHLLDANPTQPLEAFHNARVLSGHARLGSGQHRLGFAQDPQQMPSPPSYAMYEAVMLLAILQ